MNSEDRAEGKQGSDDSARSSDFCAYCDADALTVWSLVHDGMVVHCSECGREYVTGLEGEVVR